MTNLGKISQLFRIGRSNTAISGIFISSMSCLPCEQIYGASARGSLHRRPSMRRQQVEEGTQGEPQMPSSPVAAKLARRERFFLLAQHACVGSYKAGITSPEHIQLSRDYSNVFFFDQRGPMAPIFITKMESQHTKQVPYKFNIFRCLTSASGNTTHTSRGTSTAPTGCYNRRTLQSIIATNVA